MFLFLFFKIGNIKYMERNFYILIIAVAGCSEFFHTINTHELVIDIFYKKKTVQQYFLRKS